MPEITIESLQSQVQQQQRTIESLQIQLAQLTVTDWLGLVSDLQAAGFYDWACEAITIAVADPLQPGNLIDEVSALKSAASVGDLKGVLTNFATIAAVHPPIQYAVSWQTVLDDRGIPEGVMSFKPFIEETRSDP